MEQFKLHLEQHGIRPSLQRMMIYKYLYNNHNHPTADDIYTALAPSIPTLSKTTVYNTLKLFVHNGVAITLNIEGNELRYDSDTSVHGHFKCKGCGNLFDIRISKAPEIEGIDGFQVDEYQINLKGYCKICKVEK
jgi:Fur family peroxide stress response transcriptional regulator